MTFLARFFRPKWQHSNPQVRRQALVKLSAQKADEHAILLDLAAHDPESEVRRAAVKRVSDLAFLRRRAQEDSDAGVREVAGARYRQLLAGGAELADLDVRLREIADCGDETVLAHVARRGREPELRLAAMERLQASAVLEEIAVHDSVPKLRQAAVARLSQPAALERVMRQSKDRDRKVSRIAREALERLQQEREAAARARAERLAVCEALERLAEAGWREAANAERRRLENRWAAVAVEPEPALLERFHDAQGRCDAAAEQAAAARAAAAERAAAAVPALEASLAAVMADPQPDARRLEELREAIEAAPAGVPARPLALLRGYHAAAQRYLDREPALADALAASEQSADETKQRLRQLLSEIDWPAEIPAPEAVTRAAAALQARDDTAPPPRDDTARQQRAEQRVALQELLDELESHLAAGRLKPAQRLLGRAQKLAEHLPGQERERLERRLKRDTGRVRELQDWRRFATLPKQESLCEQMEALVEADLPPPKLAERIHQLQEAWKATGGSGSVEGQQLWERFRTAGDRAFDRCRNYFDEQAQRRQANLERRSEITAQLDGFVTQAQWEQLDLAALEAIRNQARREWLAATPVDRRAVQPIETRFESLMEAITGQIRDKQRANRERKQALIEQARRLVEADDPRTAADQAKSLQAEWKTVGPAQPNVDRKLWRDFRAACDEIFGRRDAARGEVDRERQARLAQAEALCTEAEALVVDEAVAPAEIEARLTELRDAYQGLGPLPRDEARRFSQRLRETERALETRRRRQAQARERSVLQAAFDRAQLCAEVEQAVLSGASSDLDVLRERWQAMEQAPAALQSRLHSRWQRALAAADGSRPFAAEELASNLETRWDLCLRMEILAGIDAPPEERARRMDLQVRRLADGMTSGRQSAAEQLRELHAEWLGTGPAAPGERADELARRFQTAVDNLAE